MNAGRELDALVAEKVMGERVDPDFLRHPVNGHNYFDPPAYSTDIAAAWEVVEKLDLFGKRGMSLSKDWRGDYLVSSTEDCGMGTYEKEMAAQKSAPHAICLAALKAVGVEV